MCFTSPFVSEAESVKVVFVVVDDVEGSSMNVVDESVALLAFALIESRKILKVDQLPARLLSPVSLYMKNAQLLVLPIQVSRHPKVKKLI